MTGALVVHVPGPAVLPCCRAARSLVVSATLPYYVPPLPPPHPPPRCELPSRVVTSIVPCLSSPPFFLFPSCSNYAALVSMVKASGSGAASASSSSSPPASTGPSPKRAARTSAAGLPPKPPVHPVSRSPQQQPRHLHGAASGPGAGKPDGTAPGSDSGRAGDLGRGSTRVPSATPSGQSSPVVVPPLVSSASPSPLASAGGSPSGSSASAAGGGAGAGAGTSGAVGTPSGPGVGGAGPNSGDILSSPALLAAAAAANEAKGTSTPRGWKNQRKKVSLSLPTGA
jgi:hypothetical protein